MEFLKAEHFKALSNPGVLSEQLLSPHNSASERITITREVRAGHQSENGKGARPRDPVVVVAARG
jgi:hypothetical protein